MAEVEIIRREEGTRTNEAGVLEPVMAVTYQSAAIAPRTVILPLVEANNEAIAAAIRDDIADVTGRTSETLEI